MTIQSFSQVLESAKLHKRISVSVAAAHDLEVLRSIQAAYEEDLIFPYLIGDETEIERLMHQLNMNADTAVVIPAATDEESAYLAAKLADEGTVSCVMKGLLNSSVFLKGILSKDLDLRREELLSHVSIFEIPGFSRLLYVTDGGLNVHPTVEQKDIILRNTIRFLHRIGLQQPRVAMLAANEKVMHGMPVTEDAEILALRARAGAYGSVLADGPMPLDLAISPEAALHKHLHTETDGQADLLFAPTIEVGNILGKAITYFGHGTMAGLVLGAKVPLVLTSRADSFHAKFVSLAFSVLEAAKLTPAAEHFV